jgi:hypothetical protein
MARYKQIPLGSARTGWQAAFLESSAEELSKSLGLKFERVRDDLDDMDAAQIRTNSGVSALFGIYLHTPTRGVSVYIDELADDPSRDLAEVLDAIRDANVRVIWKDPKL